MQEEEFNKDWKQNLDDATDFTHAALQNKDAAWEKLYARLDEKPHQKRVAWFWLAAACLFFVIAIPMFSLHHPLTTAKNNAESNDAKRSITKNNEPIKQVATQIPIAQTQLTSPKNIIAKSDVKKYVSSDTSLAATLIITNRSSDSLNQNTASVIADSTSKTMAASTSTQKKLKVVHINELGEPVEFNTDVAHTTNLHLFQLKLAQQEIYNASTIAANSNSAISFKPRNSPN